MQYFARLKEVPDSWSASDLDYPHVWLVKRLGGFATESIHFYRRTIENVIFFVFDNEDSSSYSIF